MAVHVYNPTYGEGIEKEDRSFRLILSKKHGILPPQKTKAKKGMVQVVEPA
jgi:hypothetical protein